MPKEFGIDKDDDETLSDDELKKALEDGKIVTTSFELNAPGFEAVK